MTLPEFILLAEKHLKGDVPPDDLNTATAILMKDDYKIRAARNKALADKDS